MMRYSEIARELSADNLRFVEVRRKHKIVVLRLFQ